MKVADFSNMSDEDLQGLDDSAFSDVTLEETPEPAAQDQQEEQQLDPAPAEDDGQKTEGEADAGGAEGDDKEGEKPEVKDLSDEDINKETPPVPIQDKPVAEAITGGEKADTDEVGKAADSISGAQVADTVAAGSVNDKVLDYKSEYEKLIGVPIKANGKDIVLKNADEAKRLIQQGAGYAQKMEQLKPARKSAAMLEAAGLLGDENALGHMIDLYNGDPKAIAKLVKDLKIDIFSVDMDAADQYTPRSHLQTDEAVTFKETLKEVRTLEGGNEALALIDKWDQKSKDMVWGNAQAVRQIYEYKQSGIYDEVATEVERRRTLGQIPAGEPFILSFQAVGDEMARAAQAAETASNASSEPVTPPTTAPAKAAERVPVHSGPAPRKTQAPDPRANAAASPRVGAGQAKQIPDIYALSDADFEKLQTPPA